MCNGSLLLSFEPVDVRVCVGWGGGGESVLVLFTFVTLYSDVKTKIEPTEQKLIRFFGPFSFCSAEEEPASELILH